MERKTNGEETGERKLKFTNAAQFSKLVLELEKIPDFAQRFNRGTVPPNFKSKWDEISRQLNNLGPPTRDGDGWQKVWRDLRLRVRKKLNNPDMYTSNGAKLSPLEKAVANLMESSIQSDGFESELHESQESMTIKQEQDAAFFTDESEPEDYSHAQESLNTHYSNTNIQHKDQQWLLEEIGDGEKKDLSVKVFKDLARTMLAIQNTFEGIKNIQEQKLNYLKRKNEREEELFKSEMQLKQIKLEIKRKKLEMLNEI